MALTNNSSRTGRRVQTMGAVSPPIDWATSTTSSWSPIASTTMLT